MAGNASTAAHSWRQVREQKSTQRADADRRAIDGSSPGRSGAGNAGRALAGLTPDRDASGPVPSSAAFR